MRSYQIDSPHAAGRILALSMVVDGNINPSELLVLERTKILPYIDLDYADFQQLMQELCNDLFSTVSHGTVQLDTELIDSLLAEIESPVLQRRLLRAMWAIADADEWLADAEALLLGRATNAWVVEAKC